jgi:putative FmdB family regulatory protein
MAFFDYRCKKCGHVFEEWVPSLSRADEPQTCPACGARETERLLSTPSVSTNPRPGAAAAGGCGAGSGFS